MLPKLLLIARDCSHSWKQERSKSERTRAHIACATRELQQLECVISGSVAWTWNGRKQIASYPIYIYILAIGVTVNQRSDGLVDVR